MINGWELLEPARLSGVTFVRACVRFGDHAREVAIDRLEVTLGAMIFQDDFTLDDPEVENARFDFAVWDDAGQMWYRGIRNGLVELRSMPSTPLSWLAAQPAGTLSQFDEIDIERERTERQPLPLVVAPDGLPDSVVERLQQIADAAVPITLDIEQRHVDDRTPEQLNRAEDFLRGESGIEMMRRRAARADPAAVLKAIDEFGTEPPQPGDEIDDEPDKTS